jgi:uncharacterized protein
MSASASESRVALSSGRLANTGDGPTLVPVDLGHATHTALVDPDTAFWALVKKDRLAATLASPRFLSAYREKAESFRAEMHALRFGLTPSAVYFNPTERCNLNCYIPAPLRREGRHMTGAEMDRALSILKDHFAATLPAQTVSRKPQIVFHGAEPLLNREALFASIARFREDFRFGVQTNATLLTAGDVAFLREHGVSVGISLDGATAGVADRTRTTWGGSGVYGQVVNALKLLEGYPALSVIATVTTANLRGLPKLVDFLHGHGVSTCLLNAVRCTLPGAREVKPAEADMARGFIKALERADTLRASTGRKMVVANFANILLAILAPTARRLMCDISPCGGGRCFFALAPDGGLFPCSEFIGLPEFNGGNLFETGGIAKALASPAFATVTGRKVEDIEPCRRCAIRHFCGSPCPAEAHEMRGGMDQRGAFCGFYEEQVRYALSLIADGRERDFLWDGWDDGVETVFEVRMA